MVTIEGLAFFRGIIIASNSFLKQLMSGSVKSSEFPHPTQAQDYGMISAFLFLVNVHARSCREC